MDNLEYLWIGVTLFWLMTFVCVISLIRRQQKLQKSLTVCLEHMEKARKDGSI